MSPHSTVNASMDSCVIQVFLEIHQPYVLSSKFVNWNTINFKFPPSRHHPLCHNVLWCLNACTRLSIVVRSYAPELLYVSTYITRTTTTAIRLLVGLQSNGPRASILSAQFHKRRRNALQSAALSTHGVTIMHAICIFMPLPQLQI